jgi:hypothetical protein
VTRAAATALAAALLAAVAGAADPKQLPQLPPPTAAKAAPPKTDPAEAEALSKFLREQVGKKVPDPLTSAADNWGNQVTVYHRHRLGFRNWTEPVPELVNHGLWRRVTVRIPDPDKIAIAVTELTRPTPDTANVTVAVTADRVDVRMENQLWRLGNRLYSGETRAHCKAGLQIKAEVTSRTEPKPGSFFPDVVLTIKATDAKIFYDGVVVDHTAGLDGDAARTVGDLVIRTVKAVAPDLEGDLLAKANAAVLKAAGTREVKVALDKLLGLAPKK